MTDLGIKESTACGGYGKVVRGAGRRWEYRSVCRRWVHGSSSDGLFKISNLIVILVQLVFLSSYCYGSYPTQSSPISETLIERGRGRSILQVSGSGASNPNCTKTYTAAKGVTCASLRSSQNLSQAQILELNPDLNCKTLPLEGKTVCVRGIPEHCNHAIVVTKGPTTNTCLSIANQYQLSSEGFFILNPGLSCPESPGNNNSWPNTSLVCVAPGLGQVFMEYMGASGTRITFNDVQPLVQSYSSVVYHVILAFAIDTDAKGTLQNGTFTPYWHSSLDPLSAQAFKADFPGAQILMSLGGSSQFINSSSTVPVIWQDPPNAEEWISNAQASVTKIAQNYSIDGIDIDYQNFLTTNSNFSYCIGTLIGRLKGNNTIGVATIAPFGAVLPQYQNLMNNFGDLFDYVNFQFYVNQLHTVASYIQEFNTEAGLFPPWKLLASTQINGNNSITGSTFANAVVQIAKTRGLPGVMLFEADDSLRTDFPDERGILSLLNGQPFDNSTTGLSPGPAPGPSPFAAITPSLAPRSSLVPAPAPGSSLAPAPAPELSRAPAPAPESSLAPAPAPKSSLAPGAAPGSSIVPGPAPESTSLGPSTGPTPQSAAPEGLLGSSWSWRSPFPRDTWFVFLTTAVILFSL